MKFIKRVISDSGLNEKMVELLEYEFVDRKPTKIYVLDTDEEYFLNSLLLVLDSNELNDSEKVKKIRESVLAIQSSFALELYIPFNAIKTYTEYYVTNYKKEKKTYYPLLWPNIWQILLIFIGFWRDVCSYPKYLIMMKSVCL